MHSDPLSDFLIKLKNASHSRQDRVAVPFSKIKKAIADLLTHRGFVKNAHMDTVGKKEMLLVGLDPSRDPLEIKRMSKVGQRNYVPATEVRRVRNGLGFGIYSTSQGVLPDSELRKRKIGGEYICEIY